MKIIRHSLKAVRAIGLLLLISMLVSGFQPVHYHLHHYDDHNTGQHMHDIDLHANTDQSHHDENTQAFDAGPQGMNKKLSQDNLGVVLLMIVLLLLPLLNFRLLSRLRQTFLNNWQFYSYLTPQLRAPPAK